MALDYEKRLQSLRSRRFDDELNESILSKSFSSEKIPKNIKYLMESMLPLDKKYNDKTLEAAKRVQNHLEDNLHLHFERTYRTQGSITTSTNIKVHSDFDLLTIINHYYFHSPDIPNNNPYTKSEPNYDIKLLREQSVEIMEEIYKQVDKGGKKNISITNKSLNRKVDIVFAFWYNTKKYEETLDEYYRGVYLFDFTKNKKILDFPFAHIEKVNLKGKNTNDGSKRGIRLLKTLKADNPEITLNSFILTTIVHSIDNDLLFYYSGKEITIAKVISNHLNILIFNDDYRRNIKSPNKTEQPLKDEIVPDLKLLKTDLDELITDIEREASLIYFTNKEIIYS